MRPVKAVLFDLDGTLLDTAADLGLALNTLLAAHKRPPLPLSTIRPIAGQGSRGLLKTGFNMEETHPHYSLFSEALLNHYDAHILSTTRLFPGIEAVLTYLEQMQIPWGIVTNKPQKFTQKLIEGLKLATRAACIISGDTLPHRKPHPEPVLRACELLNEQPKDCLYIGDAEIDIMACKAAGTTSLVALYGYIPSDINPREWNADGYIKHPLEILQWMKRLSDDEKCRVD